VRYARVVKLYDFNSIVASVGGSLGLFLGFSCLGLAGWIISKIPNKATETKLFVVKTVS